jgi:hypothetical protein
VDGGDLQFFTHHWSVCDLSRNPQTTQINFPMCPMLVFDETRRDRYETCKKLDAFTARIKNLLERIVEPKVRAGISGRVGRRAGGGAGGGGGWGGGGGCWWWVGGAGGGAGWGGWNDKIPWKQCKSMFVSFWATIFV